MLFRFVLTCIALSGAFGFTAQAADQAPFGISACPTLRIEDLNFSSVQGLIKNKPAISARFRSSLLDFPKLIAKNTLFFT